MPSATEKPTAKSSRSSERGRHHHRVGDAVVVDRQRGFFGDIEAALAEARADPVQGSDGAPGWCGPKAFVGKAHLQIKPKPA